MRVDVRPRKRNAPRIAEKSAPGFLQWLRGRSCMFSAWDGCEGKIEAMHLDFAGGKGIGSKVADKYCVPACGKHHRLQHSQGWVTFLRAMRLSRQDMLDAAETLWRLWPGRIAWERKLEANGG